MAVWSRRRKPLGAELPKQVSSCQPRGGSPLGARLNGDGTGYVVTEAHLGDGPLRSIPRGPWAGNARLPR